MPFDRYMGRKQRSELTRFGLVGGVRADTSPGVTPVLNSNNVFPSPDGTEMVPRDGIEIRKRYALTTEPAGRKALVVETAPPDVALGFLFMIIDTEAGGNKIERASFMRYRTQLPMESDLSHVYIGSQSSVPAPGALNDAAFRYGNMDIATTVFYRTVDGTAVAGVDYTAASGIFSFNAGFEQSENSVVVNVAGGAGKYFTLELYNPGPRTILADGSINGLTGIMVVNII